MTDRIETTEQARTFLRARVRKGIVASVGAFVGVQVLITIGMLGSTYMDVGFVSLSGLGDVVVVGKRGGTPMRFWPLFWLSIGVFAVIFGAFGFWFTGRRLRHANRLLPRIEHGTRIGASVVGVHTEREQKGNMQYVRMRLSVLAEDGREYHAVHEEPIGTELPQVQSDIPAVVWTSPSGYVIAAGEGLFEGP